MGTWGPGLYSNDIAKDLKATISAVVRLPFENGELLDIIVKCFPEAANDTSDEDHTTFWLVLANQFHRQGIDCRELFDRGIAILDSGKDLNAPSINEMGPADQRKREKTLLELRDRLTQKRMELEVIGKLDIDAAQTTSVFPDLRDGTYSAINDISIANSFYVPKEPRDYDENITSLSTLTASKD